MAKKYIHELRDWPGFTWDSKALAPLLSVVQSVSGHCAARPVLQRFHRD